MELKNSTVLITGGTSGIGLEFVSQLDKLGANIIITARNLEALEDTRRWFSNIHTIQSDVSNPREIEKLHEKVTKQFPDLNIIINCAGVMHQIDLYDNEFEIDKITNEIDTNLSGTIQMVHQFLPHLIKQKSAAIINVSSAIAFMSYSIAPVYSASKAGVHAYTKALRLQLEKSNVQVFEVLPPGVKTNLQNGWKIPPPEGRMMTADKAVADAIKDILKNKLEITPGLARIVKLLSRFAPNYIEKNVGHKEFKKLAALKNN